MIPLKRKYIRRIYYETRRSNKKLRYPELPDGLVMVGLEARQEAIKALEKQIPKKPNNMKSILDFSGRYYTDKNEEY